MDKVSLDCTSIINNHANKISKFIQMPVIPMGIEFKTRSPRFRCETVVVVQESKVMSRNAKKAQLATLWDSQEINRFLCQTWLILECT